MRDKITRASSEPNTPFIPYHSPLALFRSYRFHPQFRDAIQGGLKSLTYSGKIDLEVEVCPFELDGQECPNGASCQYQHFQSMVARGKRMPQSPSDMLTPGTLPPLGSLTRRSFFPSDDQILVDLGRSDDFTGEQKARFVQGLKGELQKFRNEKVRDFNTIAFGIIDYRRRFLGDGSKVLSHLEGVSL